MPSSTIAAPERILRRPTDPEPEGRVYGARAAAAEEAEHQRKVAERRRSLLADLLRATVVAEAALQARSGAQGPEERPVYCANLAAAKCATAGQAFTTTTDPAKYDALGRHGRELGSRLQALALMFAALRDLKKAQELAVSRSIPSDLPPALLALRLEIEARVEGLAAVAALWRSEGEEAGGA